MSLHALLLSILLTQCNLLTYATIAGYNHAHLRDSEIVRIKVFEQATIRNRIAPMPRKLRFSAFTREFELEVRERYRSSIARDFKVFVENANGSRQSLLLNSDRFLSGTLVGEPGSYFSLTEAEGRFNGAIFSRGEHFYVNHLSNSAEQMGSSSGDHLVYRLKDVDFSDFEKHSELRRVAYESLGRQSTSKRSCKSGGNCSATRMSDLIDPTKQPNGERLHWSSSETFSGHSRVKRDLPTKNTCPLLLVTDYTFCQTFGGGNPVLTAYYLVSMINRVDQIYRTTSFDGLLYFGFQVRTIVVHCEPTWPSSESSSTPQLHFNMAVSNHTFTASDFLFTFGSASELEFDKHCLAHLFSARQFNGIYGLGLIAGAQPVHDGGLCSRAMNVAWSTHIDMNGVRMLTARSDVLVGHEMGHNWGAQHDPITDECSPSNNRFMMYAYAMPGYDSNNRLFSPCSVRGVAAVLAIKSDWCFVERSNDYCGNSIVENNEQCDAGFAGLQGSDPCCDASCQLRSGAVCSDVNTVCCANCQPASSTVVCSGASSDNSNSVSCVGPSHCAGSSSLQCVSGEPVDDGKSCADQGICRSGVCVPFCESRNLISCACSNVTVSCVRCCRDVSGECSPWSTDGTFTPVLDYQPCTQGYCISGACQQQVATLTSRVWAFLNNISINYVVEFMRNNIVGTIIVFSLILWIPFCIVVACVDYKNYQKDQLAALDVLKEKSIANASAAGSNVLTSGSQTPNQPKDDLSASSQWLPIAPISAVQSSNVPFQVEPTYSRPLRPQFRPAVPAADYCAPALPSRDYAGPAAPLADYPVLLSSHAAVNPSFSQSSTSIV